MYKLVAREQVIYGRFKEYWAAQKELNAYVASKGWTVPKVFVFAVGVGNEIVYEYEYDSLATFEAEGEATFADDECMDKVRATAPFVVQGSSRSELLVSLDEA